MKGERIMQNEWIVISEYCDKCHIEPTFIDMLCESGLIDVEQEGGERYLPFSELPDVERYSRMYYDLSINMEGIDAIHHLLARMEEHGEAPEMIVCDYVGAMTDRFAIAQYEELFIPKSWHY